MKMMKPLAVMLLIAGVSGCASKSETPKLDYQSQNNKIVSLEVPPDLNDPRNGELYSLPEGTVARPDATTQRTGANSGKSVLMQVKNAHIERSGTQRWLVVQGKTANEMWPVLRSFWQEMGFTIASEEPQAGLMETEWAENRAKLPNQGLRRLFDMVGMGGIYTTSERDKFLIRMERNRQGGLDIFFTHKGLEEVYSNKREETTMWQPRANDPNLEAAFLARFMQYVGVDEAEAQRQVAVQADRDQGTEFAKREANTVLITGSAERNVNRVGSALNRIGLVVQQFVSERGMFIVRPAPTENEASANTSQKRGWFSRWFGSNKQPAEQQKPAQAAQLFVALENAGNGQRIHLLDQFGKPYTGEHANKWLDALYRELR